MTIVTVTAPEGRLTPDARRALALTLTDAVLVPEVGHMIPAARVGFQVHFRDLAADRMSIGGKLLGDHAKPPDAITVDVVVMDGAWPAEQRAAVIERCLAALAQACGQAAPSPAWWVTFRTVDEGIWGSRGGALSILDLLETGVFTPERADEIRRAMT